MKAPFSFNRSLHQWRPTWDESFLRALRFHRAMHIDRMPPDFTKVTQDQRDAALSYLDEWAYCLDRP